MVPGGRGGGRAATQPSPWHLGPTSLTRCPPFLCINIRTNDKGTQKIAHPPSRISSIPPTLTHTPPGRRGFMRGRRFCCEGEGRGWGWGFGSSLEGSLQKAPCFTLTFLLLHSRAHFSFWEVWDLWGAFPRESVSVKMPSCAGSPRKLCRREGVT